MDIRFGRFDSAQGFIHSADVVCLGISAIGLEAGNVGDGRTYFSSTQ